jgi:hypothetical protein
MQKHNRKATMITSKKRTLCSHKYCRCTALRVHVTAATSLLAVAARSMSGLTGGATQSRRRCHGNAWDRGGL